MVSHTSAATNLIPSMHRYPTNMPSSHPRRPRRPGPRPRSPNRQHHLEPSQRQLPHRPQRPRLPQLRDPRRRPPRARQHARRIRLGDSAPRPPGRLGEDAPGPVAQVSAGRHAEPGRRDGRRGEGRGSRRHAVHGPVARDCGQVAGRGRCAAGRDERGIEGLGSLVCAHLERTRSNWRITGHAC
jgi:hypothetical protein